MTPPREEDLLLVYRQTIRPLYAYVSRRVGGDRGLAEDLVQETWMRALNDWPRKGVPDEPLAWLVRVARNTLVSHFRKMRPDSLEASGIDLEDERFSPDTPDSAAMVGWGMAQLRTAHAEILEEFYFEGKTQREIAEQHSSTERAIEGKLRRARAKLKKKLSRFMPVAKGRTQDVQPRT